ncbi:MAG: hypothetical protein GDA51_01640 [Ekhidna sp.]|nr:hypothetical protein [Ekhidna sp.]MBC6410438.1 hypothetical protein [Ekhidna sp.]MBC6425178.1 hypothetical protein [Ekhidna sp.]
MIDENPPATPPIAPDANTRMSGSFKLIISEIFDENDEAFSTSNVQACPIHTSPTPKKPEINAFNPEEGAANDTAKEANIHSHHPVKGEIK